MARPKGFEQILACEPDRGGGAGVLGDFGRRCGRSLGRVASDGQHQPRKRDEQGTIGRTWLQLRIHPEQDPDQRAG